MLISVHIINFIFSKYFNPTKIMSLLGIITMAGHNINNEINSVDQRIKNNCFLDSIVILWKTILLYVMNFVMNFACLKYSIVENDFNEVFFTETKYSNIMQYNIYSTSTTLWEKYKYINDIMSIQ